MSNPYFWVPGAVGSSWYVLQQMQFVRDLRGWRIWGDPTSLLPSLPHQAAMISMSKKCIIPLHSVLLICYLKIQKSQTSRFINAAVLNVGRKRVGLFGTGLSSESVTMGLTSEYA